MGTKVGDCPNCGYVIGDSVDMEFPVGAACTECGSALDHAKMATDAELEEVGVAP
jgi:DNA-directed RNA polymerase subunit RPC12/RpoP